MKKNEILNINDGRSTINDNDTVIVFDSNLILKVHNDIVKSN